MAIESSVAADAALRSSPAAPFGLRKGSGASEYEVCNETMNRICGPYRVESDRWWNFRGGLRNFNVAALNVTDIRLSDGKVIKDNRGDERYRGDYYFLVLQIDGVARMCQRGAEAVLRPGDSALIDSRFASVFDVGEGIRQYSFNFPAATINARFGKDSSVICRRIAGAAGPGVVLADTLRSIVRNADTLNGADLSAAALQLLAAAVGRAGNGGRAEVERAAVSARDITDYIDAHVHNLMLSPQDIAAHFNVSLRQLYRIAAGADCTPSALIWTRRLRRARELLARSPHLPITEIAFSCGFKDGAHFSRSYRKAFGQTPRLARRAAPDLTSA
jgi:AraC family transcriptional regulator, positive regulator of tynA and feaB